MPLISVVIPTFNHAQYVRETVESVKAQTFGDYEIIVVNDGSPDNTAQVLSSYVASGDIRYFEQPNLGQATARNLGIRHARGEFIALLDDDDLWPADRLEWQVDVLRREARVAVIGGAVQLIDEQGLHVGAAPIEDGEVRFESLFRGSPFWSPGQTLIRADALRQVGGLDSRVWGGDDMDLWFRLARRAVIRTIPRLALRYRVHSQNASRNVARMYLNLRAVMESHLRWVAHPDRPRLRRDAYRSLYGYAGHKLLDQMLWDVRVGNISAAGKKLTCLLTSGAAALRDRALARQICRDLYHRMLEGPA
jgi:glycosyltransferase involved in cell wall biosynthesis